MPGHSDRKADHLDLCETDQVAFQDKTTLLEQVHLVHNALPELAVADVDLQTELVGHTLRAPLVISAMTGGVEKAARVNKALAAVAQTHGLAMGFGSMRPMLEDGVDVGYQVRDVAPDILLMANLGVVQAGKASTQQIADMVGQTGCNALAIHLNPAMEVVQPGGDDDFRGGVDTIARLVEDLQVPVLVKETGCGLSRSVGERLIRIGVQWVDTSGAGGTSWVGVETLRADATKALGEQFWDWGIPTAASIAQLSGLGLGIVATGGIRNGLDIARAIALGATAGGIARGFLQAWAADGEAGASKHAEQVIAEIRTACLLTGSRTPKELQSQPLVVGAALARWIPSNTPLRHRIVSG